MDNDFLYEMEELMNNGKFREVINKIRDLDEDEINTELYLMLAHALSQCAQYQEALSTLKDIEDDTADDDMGYHLELAGALFGLHRYKAAVKEAKFCIELDETCVEPWLLLGLVYQETGDDDKFNYVSDRARELDESAWDSIFGDRSDELVSYEHQDTQIVLEFITKHLGQPECVFQENDDNENEKTHTINCVLIKPDKENDFYKVVSVGIGAYRGIDTNNNNKLHRIEMAAFLPPHYTIEEIKTKYNWLPKIIRQFGEMLQYDNSWLAAGHSISYGDPLDEKVDYNGVIFNDLFVESPYRDKCILSDGEEVDFLRLIPLYEEEMMFKIENGYTALFNRIMEKLTPEQIDVIIFDRPNTCLNENGGKKWYIPRSSLENLLEWNDSDGCYATDRITVDGCRIGFMYREVPHDKKFDSGWRFLAGDESADYMNDLNNMDIFNLNTICNYDPDIIEFLDSPVGSAFYRDKNGYFRKAN